MITRSTPITGGLAHATIVEQAQSYSITAKPVTTPSFTFSRFAKTALLYLQSFTATGVIALFVTFIER